jgi:SAM-dependent methyltransferase
MNGTSSDEVIDKEAVRAHWEQEPCGTRGVQTSDRRRMLDEVEKTRYAREPFIFDFARFRLGVGLRVLEVGVGAGSDFANWARHGARAVGVDLTEHAVRLTKERISLEGLTADAAIADAERLPFRSNAFDIVYSYGVLHHSPDTARAISEVYRVLKPGGSALLMLYHLDSFVAWIVWAAHCLARLRPWRGRRWALARHLESPGTKAYTVAEARTLMREFAAVAVRPQLTAGDLLLVEPSHRYHPLLFRLASAIYPRALVKRLGNRFGFFLLIEARKPATSQAQER